MKMRRIQRPRILKTSRICCDKAPPFWQLLLWLIGKQLGKTAKALSHLHMCHGQNLGPHALVGGWSSIHYCRISMSPYTLRQGQTSFHAGRVVPAMTGSERSRIFDPRAPLRPKRRVRSA